jgi:hypothetical protein
MFVLGHLGIGLGLAWLLTYRRPISIDYRLVLVGTLLPDLIDKPLGLLLGLEGRLWAHTLLFLVGLLAVSRIPRIRGLQWVGFGVATHLLLDQIWQSPNVALWPFDGPFLPATFNPLSYVHTLLTNPYVGFGEVLGAVILVALGWWCGILSWAAFRAFLRTGTLVRRPSAASG